MNPDVMVYGAAVVAGGAYALLLEYAQRRWRVLPDFTELEVVGGVAIAFALIYWRITLGVPWITPTDAAWWTFGVAVRVFACEAVFITLWQMWRLARNHLAAARRMWQRFGKDG